MGIVEGKVVSKESTWMWKCDIQMYNILEVLDLEQLYSLRSGTYSDPPCLLNMKFTKPW